MYGLGTYEDGRPYYAMRFVKGDDLRVAIKRFHEAAHGGLCPWRPLNEYLGRAIGLYGFMSLTLYRAPSGDAH